MKVKHIDRITDCRHLNMFRIAYADMRGREKHWQIATRRDTPKCVTGQFNVPDAVVIVAYHKEKRKLVLIKEFRVALNDYQYGFPAGLIDDGESIRDASIREFKEETGMRVIGFTKISPPVYSSTGMTDESVSMVYVECDGSPSNKGNESSEDIHTLFVSPSEAAALCGDETLMFDVKTWLVLTVFAQHGHL